jgi:hypothetical protein
MKKLVLYGVLGTALLLAGLAASVSLAGNGYGHSTISTITQTTGGGHTPVTICHKPGTPAEMTLVVDDDAVPGHLGHGDYLGECQPPVTTTGTTETTPTDTTPTTTTPTTPVTPRCPPGEGPFAGKDGQPGMQECCPDADNNQQCDVPAPTSPVTPHSDPTPTSTTQTLGATVVITPKAKPTPKPKKRVVLAHKQPKPDKPVKLTGNPKKDKCKDLCNGTMRCKGVVVTQGSG